MLWADYIVVSGEGGFPPTTTHPVMAFNQATKGAILHRPTSNYSFLSRVYKHFGQSLDLSFEHSHSPSEGEDALLSQHMRMLGIPSGIRRFTGWTTLCGRRPLAR